MAWLEDSCRLSYRTKNEHINGKPGSVAVPRPERLLCVVRAAGKPGFARAAGHRRADADGFRCGDCGKLRRQGVRHQNRHARARCAATVPERGSRASQSPALHRVSRADFEGGRYLPAGREGMLDRRDGLQADGHRTAGDGCAGAGREGEAGLARASRRMPYLLDRHRAERVSRQGRVRRGRHPRCAQGDGT